MAKINDFVKAQAQLAIEGRVREAVANYRLAVCTGRDENNHYITDTCSHYSGDSNIRGDGKCKVCGCKTWKISEMKIKVYYPIGCPIGRFAAMYGRKQDDGRRGPRQKPEA